MVASGVTLDGGRRDDGHQGGGFRAAFSFGLEVKTFDAEVTLRLRSGQARDTGEFGSIRIWVINGWDLCVVRWLFIGVLGHGMVGSGSSVRRAHLSAW